VDRQELFDAGGDALVEIGERLTAGNPVPLLGDGATFALGEDPLHLLNRRAVETWSGDLRQPLMHRRIDAEGPNQRLGGLDCPAQRRHEEVVDPQTGEGFGEVTGLTVPEFGQVRVVDTAPIGGPCGLCVANEEEFHRAEV